MCGPEKGRNTPEAMEREAVLMGERQGMGERRMNGNGNGRIWDAFWKVLSLLVIPWATGVTWLLFNVSTDVTEVKIHYEDLNRRLVEIERQMDPEFRFYRWDGKALADRLTELEGLHPRERAE